MPITSNGKFPVITGEFSIHPMLNNKNSFKKIKLDDENTVQSLYSIKGENLNYETYITINFIIQEIEKITENNEHLQLTIKNASNKILRKLKKSSNMGELALYQKIKIAELEARSYELQKESLTDPLTKLANRRLVDSKLDELINNFSRNPQEFSIFILDIDFFKKINDTFGHDIGDITLKGLADILNNELRIEDTVSRRGGEEFLIILKGSNHNIALQKAENIRKIIESELIKCIKETQNLNKFCPHTNGCIYEKNCQNNNLECFPSKITCSIGVATIQTNNGEVESKCHFIKRADSALYIAKESGRNKIYSGKGLEIEKKEDLC